MIIHVISIFPEYFTSPLATSLVGRARDAGHVSFELHDPRQHAEPPHNQVDDTPYGGGPGMVMMVEPLAKTLDPLEHTHRILLTPAGRPVDQSSLDDWATRPEITLLCGRYEGVDERVAEHLVDEEASLGDFVLLGGEAAALAVIEGVVRLLPGVVGNPDSVPNESFRHRTLEEPHYTRPAEFRGWRVPEVLLSGDHGKIEAWRVEQRRKRTAERRPDLTDR